MPNEGVVGGPIPGDFAKSYGEAINGPFAGQKVWSGKGELYAALSKAQGAMHHAKKDKENPFFKSSYADLASVMDACRSALVANGLAVVQTMEEDEKGLFLVTTLGHTSGQSITSRMAIKPTKNDPQGVGSALTYARRYALSAIVGVATEDDDGNAASAPSTPKRGKEAKAQATAHIPDCPDCENNSQVVQAVKNPAAGAWGCLKCHKQFDVQD